MIWKLNDTTESFIFQNLNLAKQSDLSETTAWPNLVNIYFFNQACHPTMKKQHARRENNHWETHYSIYVK